MILIITTNIAYLEVSVQVFFIGINLRMLNVEPFIRKLSSEMTCPILSITALLNKYDVREFR